MRHYATLEDTGERVLHVISCDHAGCAAKIKPNPDIANSGWVKSGVINHIDGITVDRVDYDYCPDHAGDV